MLNRHFNKVSRRETSRRFVYSSSLDVWFIHSRLFWHFMCGADTLWGNREINNSELFNHKLNIWRICLFTFCEFTSESHSINFHRRSQTKTLSILIVSYSNSNGWLRDIQSNDDWGDATVSSNLQLTNITFIVKIILWEISLSHLIYMKYDTSKRQKSQRH